MGGNSYRFVKSYGVSPVWEYEGENLLENGVAEWILYAWWYIFCLGIRFFVSDLLEWEGCIAITILPAVQSISRRPYASVTGYYPDIPWIQPWFYDARWMHSLYLSVVLDRQGTKKSRNNSIASLSLPLLEVEVVVLVFNPVMYQLSQGIVDSWLWVDRYMACRTEDPRFCVNVLFQQ